jgi:hypothetical protein
MALAAAAARRSESNLGESRRLKDCGRKNSVFLSLSLSKTPVAPG